MRQKLNVYMTVNKIGLFDSRNGERLILKIILSLCLRFKFFVFHPLRNKTYFKFFTFVLHAVNLLSIFEIKYVQKVIFDSF